MEALWKSSRFGFPHSHCWDGHSVRTFSLERKWSEAACGVVVDVRRRNAVPTVPGVASSCLDEDSRRLWHFATPRYWVYEHYLETWPRLRHTSLVGCQNVKIFSIILADHRSLYPILPSWWDDHACPYLLFVLMPLVFLYYGGLFLRGSSDDIMRVTTLGIPEFAIMDGVLFILSAAEGSVPD